MSHDDPIDPHIDAHNDHTLHSDTQNAPPSSQGPSTALSGKVTPIADEVTPQDTSAGAGSGATEAMDATQGRESRLADHPAPPVKSSSGAHTDAGLVTEPHQSDVEVVDGMSKLAVADERPPAQDGVERLPGKVDAAPAEPEDELELIGTSTIEPEPKLKHDASSSTQPASVPETDAVTSSTPAESGQLSSSTNAQPPAPSAQPDTALTEETSVPATTSDSGTTLPPTHISIPPADSTVKSPAISADAPSLPKDVSPGLLSAVSGQESGSATPKAAKSSSDRDMGASASTEDERPANAVDATPAPSKASSTAPGITPAPVQATQPGAPAKPRPGPLPEEAQATPARTEGLPSFATPGTSTRISPDLAEFDPFATPAPPAKAPQLPQRPRIRTERSSESARSAASTHAPAPAPGPSAPAAPPQAGPSRPQRRSSQNSRSQRERAPAARRQSSEEAEPAFNFAGFLKDLKVKSAEPVAKYLKSFLTNFSKKPFTVNEQIKLIRDFLEFISERMRAVEPWKSQTEAEFDNALEAMEKLVMNRLYPYTFTPQISPSAPITTDDLERDAVFAQRVRLFGWVRENHLDVPESDAAAGFLGFAEQELLKINHYKAPRDKMICILNCCKVIFGLIRHTSGNEAGADAFIPILIFVVLRASPDNMLSNLEYINRFRNPDKLTGEAGYYLSSLSGAIQFIETMDASSLSNITQAEFERNVEKAIQDLPSSPSSPRASNAARPDMSPFATSPGEEAAKPLALPATAAALDGTRRFFQRTGDAAKEAVSRPLSAIGKILQDMQGERDSGSESGDEEGGGEGERGGRGEGERRSAAVAVQGGTPKTPSRLLAQLGLSPDSRQGSESTTPQGTPTPPEFRPSTEQYTPVPPSQAFQQQREREQREREREREREQRERERERERERRTPPLPANYHRTQGHPPFTPPPPSNLYRHQQPPQQQTPYTPPTQPVFDGERQRDQEERQRDLEERQREQAQYDHALAQSQREQWDSYNREQSKLANIATLHQMFPALDEEIVQVVLEACGEDLGAAIDRLLEM